MQSCSLGSQTREGGQGGGVEEKREEERERERKRERERGGGETDRQTDIDREITAAMKTGIWKFERNIVCMSKLHLFRCPTQSLLTEPKKQKTNKTETQASVFRLRSVALVTSLVIARNVF